MVVRPSVLVTFVAAALAGLAGCATTTARTKLADAASDLETHANLLVRDSSDEINREGAGDYARLDYPREYGRDAQALARDAHDLRAAVEDNASDSDVRAAFDRVARSYHAVRDEVDHSESIQARRDLDPVTDSYRAVEREVSVYPGREGYTPPA